MKIKPRSFRWLTCLALLAGCASTRGVQDVEPCDTLDVEWMQSQVDWRSSIRVIVGGVAFELTKPRTTAEGLEYDRARRVDSSEETQGKLPYPVPLLEIDRIEIREGSKPFEYALAGAALGMVTGAVIGARYGMGSEAPNEAMAFFGTIGGIAGLVVGASKQEWKPIFVRAHSGER